MNPEQSKMSESVRKLIERNAQLHNEVADFKRRLENTEMLNQEAQAGWVITANELSKEMRLHQNTMAERDRLRDENEVFRTKMAPGMTKAE